MAGAFTVVQLGAPLTRHCKMYPLAPITLVQLMSALLAVTLVTVMPEGAVQVLAGAQALERQPAVATSVRILLPGKGPNPWLKLIPVPDKWQ